MPLKSFSFLFIVLVGMTVLLHGCGKKSNEGKKVSRLPADPVTNEWDQRLEKQELICGTRGCPSYLAKLAIIDNNKLRFCTGFLIKSNVVVTASSCLPEYLRNGDRFTESMDEQDCKKEISFFFYESNSRPKRVSCKKVKKASALVGKEPFLWNSDVAFLEIDETLPRKILGLTRSGLPNFTEHTIWSVDQIDDYQGIIQKKEKCESVFSSYLNPFADNKISPVMTIAGCSYAEGNSGAPIIFDGKLRGIVSRPAGQKSIDEANALKISEKPLKNILYASNYACAPSLSGQDVADDTECFKEMSIHSYDLVRKEMLSETKLFKEILRKLELSYNELNPYFQLSVTLTENAEGSRVGMAPKCFKKSNEWLRNFSNNSYSNSHLDTADLTLKRSMDEYGRISAKEINKGHKTTSLQFRPKDLRNLNTADVYMWVENSPSTKFPLVPLCP
jgi:hypothetical protein